MVEILEFLLDFLSKNEASSIPRIWIFCPEFKDRDYQWVILIRNDPPSKVNVRQKSHRNSREKLRMHTFISMIV